MPDTIAIGLIRIDVTEAGQIVARQPITTAVNLADGCPECHAKVESVSTPARETAVGPEATGWSTVTPCGCPVIGAWVWAP